MCFVVMMINVVNYFVTQRDIHWLLSKVIESQDEVEVNTQMPSEKPTIIEVFSPSYQRYVFYVIQYDDKGTEVSYRTNNESLYSRDYIRGYALLILKMNTSKGRFGLYYYQIEEKDGKVVLAMLDASAVIYNRTRMFYASIMISLVCFIITLCLTVILSNRVIEPEIENTKKQIQFITDVSHELKTPLAVIRSNAEMEEILQGENEWTQSTIRQVDRMVGLINNLVMITKSQEIENDSDTENVNVTDVVKQTAGEFIAMAQQQGKNIELQIEEDITLVIRESKVRQLTMILLDNAVKYCDEGGTIVVSLQKQGWRSKGIRLVVSNTYAEGKKVDYARFFDRFYRVDQSRNIDTGGYGIGLSIAKHICTQSGGDIRVEWKNENISFICNLSK